MHVISRKRLNEFAEKYPETGTGLVNWYDSVRRNNFSSLPDLKLMFPSTDQVGRLTVFNVGGNKVRLVAAIHYNR
jgi:mRNA interferase HigB